MELHSFLTTLDWIHYVIIRLFVWLGILSLIPIFIIILMEPLVYLFRFIENYILPESMRRAKKPTRQTSMSILNLAALAAAGTDSVANPDPGGTPAAVSKDATDGDYTEVEVVEGSNSGKSEVRRRVGAGEAAAGGSGG